MTLADELLLATGINVATCYQCGKCSAGCPMAGETSLRPHNVLRLAMDDRRDELLADDSLWLCLTCETCSTRCPNGCDPARIIDAVRELSMLARRGPQERNIRAFHQAFLNQIRTHGRLFETGFMVDYKVRSGALLHDAANAPAMLRRGKLHARAEKVRDIDEVRRIFRECAAPPAPDGSERR